MRDPGEGVRRDLQLQNPPIILTQEDKRAQFYTDEITQNLTDQNRISRSFQKKRKKIPLWKNPPGFIEACCTIGMQIMEKTSSACSNSM